MNEVIDPPKPDRMAKARMKLAEKRAKGVIENSKKKLEKIEARRLAGEEYIKSIKEEKETPAIVEVPEIIEPPNDQKEILTEPDETGEESEKKMSSSEEIEVTPVPIQREIAKKRKETPQKVQKNKKTKPVEPPSASSSSESSEDEPEPKRRRTEPPPDEPHPIIRAATQAKNFVANIEVPPVVVDYTKSTFSSIGYGALVIGAVVAKGYLNNYAASLYRPTYTIPNNNVHSHMPVPNQPPIPSTPRTQQFQNPGFSMTR